MPSSIHHSVGREKASRHSVGKAKASPRGKLNHLSSMQIRQAHLVPIPRESCSYTIHPSSSAFSLAAVHACARNVNLLIGESGSSRTSEETSQGVSCTLR